MQTDDMILVSVDDHVIEPRGMFDGLLPAKYQDKAPKLIRREDGTDFWHYNGNEIPNVGLNAVVGRPPEEYGIEPTSLDDMRPGCYDVHERVTRHVGQRRARLHVLPLLPPVLRAALRPHRGQGRGPGHDPGLQRLAHRPVVRRRARPLHPALHPRHLGPRTGRGRGAPGGREGLPRRDLLGEPGEAGLALAAQRPLGPVLDGLLGRGHRGLHAPGLVVLSCSSPRWRPPSTS